MASSDLCLPVFTSWCNNFPLFPTMSWSALLLINNTQHKLKFGHPKKCGFPVSLSACLLWGKPAATWWGVLHQSPQEKGLKEASDQRPQRTKISISNPMGTGTPPSPNKWTQRDLSGKMTLLVNTLTAASWQTHGQRHPSYAVPRVLTHRCFEIKNAFCFTLLNFEAIGYPALLHSNGQLI